MKKFLLLPLSMLSIMLILTGCANNDTTMALGKNLDKNLNKLTKIVNKLDTIDNNYIANPDLSYTTNSLKSTTTGKSFSLAFNPNVITSSNVDVNNLIQQLLYNKLTEQLTQNENGNCRICNNLYTCDNDGFCNNCSNKIICDNDGSCTNCGNTLKLTKNNSCSSCNNSAVISQSSCNKIVNQLSSNDTELSADRLSVKSMINEAKEPAAATTNELEATQLNTSVDTDNTTTTTSEDLTENSNSTTNDDSTPDTTNTINEGSNTSVETNANDSTSMNNEVVYTDTDISNVNAGNDNVEDDNAATIVEEPDTENNTSNNNQNKTNTELNSQPVEPSITQEPDNLRPIPRDRFYTEGYKPTRLRYNPRYYQNVEQLDINDQLDSYINKVHKLYAMTSDALEANTTLSECKTTLLDTVHEVKELNQNIIDGTCTPSNQQIVALKNYIEDIKSTVKRMKQCNGDLNNEINKISSTSNSTVATSVDVMNSNYLSLLNHIDTRITYHESAISTLEQVKYLLEDAIENGKVTTEELQQYNDQLNNIANGVTNDQTTQESATPSTESSTNTTIDNTNNDAVNNNVDSDTTNTETTDKNIDTNTQFNTENEDLSTNVDNIDNTNSVDHEDIDNTTTEETDTTIKNIDTYKNDNSTRENVDVIENHNVDTQTNTTNQQPTTNTDNTNNTTENNVENPTNNETVESVNDNTNNGMVNNNTNINGNYTNGVITQNNLNTNNSNGLGYYYSNDGKIHNNGSDNGTIGNNGNTIENNLNRKNNVNTYGYNTMLDVINQGTVNNGINTL